MAKFVTVINCVDGWIQGSVSSWMMHQFGADFVDTITVFGPDKVLSEEGTDGNAFIVEGLRHSAKTNHTQIVAVIGHEGCTVNAVPKAEHFSQLRRSVEFVVLQGTHKQVLGLWVDAQGGIDIVAETRVE